MSHSHARDWSTHTQPAVLDIGEDVGALVLYTPPDLHGQEIEVSPLGDDARRVHTAVLLRIVNGQRICAALYPQLAAGEYRIWGDESLGPSSVTIQPGRVAEVHWAHPAG
jgi:hypothetical protein